MRALKILQGKRFWLENAFIILFLRDPSPPPFNLRTSSSRRLGGRVSITCPCSTQSNKHFSYLFIPSQQFRARKSKGTSNKGRLKSLCCGRFPEWENRMILLRILGKKKKFTPGLCSPRTSWTYLNCHTPWCYCSLFKLLDKSVRFLWICHIDKERITSLTHEITLQMMLLEPYKGKPFLSPTPRILEIPSISFESWF